MPMAPTLFDSLEDDIELRWRNFSARHPEVYRNIVNIAKHAKDQGKTYLSMKWIFEVLRGSAPRDYDSPVALNNDYTAPAVRQLKAEYPELGELFRTRKRTAA